MLFHSRGAIFAFACACALAFPALAHVSIPSGGVAALVSASSLDLACTDFNVTGNVAVGAGQVAQGATVNIGPSGVLDGGQGTISTGAGWINNGTFAPGTGTVVFTDACASGPFQFGGATTFYNLTLTSSSGRAFAIPAGTNIVVLGTLTLQGAPGNPLQLVSSAPGSTAHIVLGNGAQVAGSNAVINLDVQIGGVASSIPTLGGTGLALLALLLMLAGVTPKPILSRLAGRGAEQYQSKGEA